MTEKVNVGGQAIIEGIMMRSPSSLAIAIRRANGEIVIKEQVWESIWTKYSFLRWPIFRGSIVLIESMVNGVQALMFSADQAMSDQEKAENSESSADEAQEKTESDIEKHLETDETKPVSRWVLWSTILFSLALGFALFKGLPHMVATAIGYFTGDEITTSSISFHLIDGSVKIALFIGYVWAISFMPDMRRVFQYHGAEHKAIYTYESGKDLTVENARDFTTLHPRCGTSFIMVVLLLSIFVFVAVFPFLPEFHSNRILNAVIQIFIKLPLMLPIAGIAYEFNKWAARHMDSSIVKILIKPGLWLQLITTREPDDQQLEIALSALRKTLWREKIGAEDVKLDKTSMEVFPDYARVTF